MFFILFSKFWLLIFPIRFQVLLFFGCINWFNHRFSLFFMQVRTHLLRFFYLFCFFLFRDLKLIGWEDWFMIWIFIIDYWTIFLVFERSLMKFKGHRTLLFHFWGQVCVHCFDVDRITFVMIYIYFMKKLVYKKNHFQPVNSLSTMLRQSTPIITKITIL